MKPNSQSTSRCLILWTAAAWAIVAAHSAAAASQQDPWMTDRYEVEIVVFRHIDQRRNTPEKATPLSVINPSPLDLYPEPLSSPESAMVGPMIETWATATRQPPPVSFYLLDLANEFPDFVPFTGDRLEFDTIIARLERLEAYEPLAHLGWVQPARQSGDAVPFKIEAASDGEFNITGSVTLYKKRYIHLQVDLEMEPTNPAPEAETDSDSRRQYETSFSRERNDRTDRGPLAALDQTLVYRLNESRRIRGVDAHYFDHPQFGVIARIKEIKLDEEGSDGTGS